MSTATDPPRALRGRGARVLSAGALLCGIMTWSTTAPVAAEPLPSVVASGLDQPRGLAFAANGSLLISEAGRGGDGSDGCVAPILTDQLMCLGPTGAVTEVKRNGKQRRIIEGLPSIANQADGHFAFGPADVTTRRGTIHVAIGGPGDDLDRSELAAYGAGLGTVQRLTGRQTHHVADVAAFEDEFNPHETLLQSNTQSVQAIGRDLFVADAAGNTVLVVEGGGALRLAAVFDDRDAHEAVPSGLAEGPDGALYLADLTGFPFPDGGSIVWRLGPAGFEEYATGFTTAIDLAFGPDGSLYVVESFPGRVLHLPPGENDAGNAEVVIDALSFPTGIAVNDDGAVFVSNNGVFAGIGEVLRIR